MSAYKNCTRFVITSLIAAAASAAFCTHPLKELLEDFDTGGTAAAEAVDLSNSPAGGASNSVIDNFTDGTSPKLRLQDPDGGYNGAKVTFPGGIPAPGYYLVTAEVKVDNSTAAVPTYGMAAVAGNSTTAKLADANASYVMNLTGSGDDALGYQTIGAAIDVPAGGTFPQDLTLYFSTDVSGNDYNAPASDGDFRNGHRSNATAWTAGSSNAVYIDNIKRIGPGNFGEERHLWISVGDGFTDLNKLENQLVQAKANNFNCIDILGRYRSDAYYIPNRTDATYANPEPLGSRIGGRTVSSSTDPLQYAIDRGHELGLKVYVSFSCFLASPDATYPSTLPSGSIMHILPSGSTTARPMVTTDPGAEGLWTDPGRADVRAYTKNVLMDMVTNYDVDGVIFDRVRYPGSRYGYNPQALSDMGFAPPPATPPSPFAAAFTNARRDAITTFIGECYEAVTTAKPWVVVGASPIAFGTGMADTYNNVFQYWPKWTSRKTTNRNLSFGCLDLLQPQFYRTSTTGGAAANATLIQKAVNGDVGVFNRDFGLMPGSNMALAPLFYHPSSNDAAQSAVNSQNFVDAKVYGSNGAGLFAATTTLNDVALIRSPAVNNAGVDVLAQLATFNDYFMKAGYDNIPPNPVRNFTVAPQADGSVNFSWDKPQLAEDGDYAKTYLLYKGTSPNVKEYWSNRVAMDKVNCTGHTTYVAPRGLAGTYYYRIISVDEYNNHGPAVEVGPFTVAGDVPPPPDVIVDNPSANFTGSWFTGTFSTDRYGNDYRFSSLKTTAPVNEATFTGTIPETGTYDVFEFHPQGTNRPVDARHEITHNGGTAVALVNQQINGGKWNKIGTFQFTGGQSYSVKINSVFSGGTSVMADAIRWAYVPPAPPVPVDVVVDNVDAQKVGAWSTGTGAGRFGANYNFRGVGTGANQVIFTAPIVAAGLYDIWEWHVQGANRPPDARHQISRDGGVSTVLVNQQSNGAKWNWIGTFPFRGGNSYNVIIDDVFTPASGRVVMADAIKWTFAGPIPAGPPEIVVDNLAASLTSTWTSGTFAADKFASNYVSKGKASGPAGPGTATFTAELPEDGVYDVYEWHPAGSNRAQNAPHIITHMGGSDTVNVDQRNNGGKWNKLGSFQFREGLQSVVIDNSFTLGDLVMADAVKWTYVEPLPPAPLAPRELYAKVLGQASIRLNWEDRAVNETAYQVIRDGQVVATLGAEATDYTDTGLDADTEYQYYVRALNGLIKSCSSNVETKRTLPPPPVAPANLVGTVISGTEISLAWSDNADNETRYEILRNGVSIATLDADSMSYDDSGLSQCTEYVYTVTASNTGGTSPESNAVAISIDVENPTISAPADVTMDNEAGKCGASNVALGTPQTDDNCEVATVSNDAPAEFAVGTTTVTWTVTDSHGNTATATQTVTVNDVEKPSITAPADVLVRTDAGACSASGVDLGSPTTADNCAVDGAATNDAPSSFPKGETVVTWTVTDIHGNTKTATQKVVVEDREDPVVSCPADVEIGSSFELLVPVDYDTPSATDNCGEVTVVCDPPSGSQFPVGTTVVTVTATDAAGNSSSCTFNMVRVELEFTGFLAPVGGCVEQGTGGSYATPVRAFKLGSTIPLKFALASEGAAVSTGVHTLTAVKYDSATSSEAAIDATPTDAATSGNAFRLTSDGQWHYNLDTDSPFTKGTWLLTATMSDGSTKSVWVDLK